MKKIFLRAKKKTANKILHSKKNREGFVLLGGIIYNYICIFIVLVEIISVKEIFKPFFN